MTPFYLEKSWHDPQARWKIVWSSDIRYNLQTQLKTPGENLTALQPTRLYQIKGPHPVPSADCKLTTPGQDTQHNASPHNQAEGASDTTLLPNPCDSGAVKHSPSGHAIKLSAGLKDYVLTWTLSLLLETNQNGT